MARERGLILNPDAFGALLATTGMTQAEVAEKVGISTATLSGLLNPPTAAALQRGKRRQGASAAVAHSLASVLRVPLGALFPETTRLYVFQDEPDLVAVPA